MSIAVTEAEKFFGMTAPNPPVGALATDQNGVILGVAAHQKAGSLHAEALLFQQLKEKNVFQRLHNLYVTLEPCNHIGKTPACTNAIMHSPAKNIYIGQTDPNPIASGGADFLRSNGKTVQFLNDEITFENTHKLIRPFMKWIKTKTPYVILKTAHKVGFPPEFSDLSMVPEKGQKTFTNENSLKIVHAYRKKSDALLTTTSTVIVDQPLLTVRYVDDFPDKIRFVSILGTKKISTDYLDIFKKNKLVTRLSNNFNEELAQLGALSVHQVYIEAGPKFSEWVHQSNQWDEFHQIIDNQYLICRRNP